jgi:PKD repeat protein
MSNASQIKTHFDVKIIMFFIVFFILSCSFLAYRKNTTKNCDLTGFKIESISLKANDLITFTDTTKSSSQWEWDFGDDSKVSYLSKATHSYEKEGVYKVKLISGGSCTVEKEIKIAPFQENIDMSLYPKFKVPANVVEGVPVTFNDNTVHAKSWKWSFGEISDGGSSEKNPTHIFKSSGMKKVALAVNDDYKYVTTIDVYVTKAQIVKDVIKDLPPEHKGAEITGKNEKDIESNMNGISKNLLTYRNFSRNFCKAHMPEVHLKDGSVISLKELDEDIRDKRLRIREIKIEKNRYGDIIRIDANYKN